VRCAVIVVAAVALWFRVEQLCERSGEEVDFWMTVTADPLNELLHGERRKPGRAVDGRVGEAADQAKRPLQGHSSRRRGAGIVGWP